ncbi:MAG: hypothetical protein P8Y64_05900 [Gammaproteobacteria bacterium]
MHHPASVLQGPSVARWRCPSCGRDVPRLLPNGQLNRHPVLASEWILPDASIAQTLQQFDLQTEFEVCLACRDTAHDLLGTLIRLELRGGRSDVGVIGALCIGLGPVAQLMMFAEENDALALKERLPLPELIPARLLYLDSPSGVPSAVWSAHQARIDTLRALLDDSA